MMNKVWVVSLCVFLASLCKGQETYDCGVVSAYLACIALDPGSVGSYGEFLNVIGPPADPSVRHGYSLEQVKVAIDSVGLHTLAVESDLEMLAMHQEQQKALAIAHLDGSHFVLFSDFVDETVEVVDFPSVYTLSKNDLKYRWQDRIALLVANEPIEEYGHANWFVWLVGGFVGVATAAFWLKRRSR